MSYTQTYHSSVTVSGSRTVSYSYPASQSGGSGSTTVHFEETVPLVFNIHVDTNPFDNSLEYAKHNVDGLTGAVVAMNAAQCQSIKQSGEMISNNIINGFYRLIESELTTQISANKSELQAKIALVLELSKDIQNAHSRMSKDINRLKVHYKEIFDGLDEDCKKRIYALDKAAFILANARDKLIKLPYVKDGAFSLNETTDLSNANNFALIARLKCCVSNVLDVMANSALNTQQYLKNVETYSENICVSDNQISYIPVIFYEQEKISEQESKDLNSVCCEHFGNTETISQSVNNYVSSVHAEKWVNFSDDEEKIIENSFLAFAEQEFASADSDEKKRVYDEIMKMWKSNTKKTFYGGK